MADEPGAFDAERVTGARQEGKLRYILLISLLLALVTMSAVWIIPSLSG